MGKNIKFQLVLIAVFLISAGGFFYWLFLKNTKKPTQMRRPIAEDSQAEPTSTVIPPKPNSSTSSLTPTLTSIPTAGLSFEEIPERKVLTGGKHMFQTYNNCGPASLSMALSYFGINTTQEELGRQLRPYQNKEGDNDDKTTTFKEQAEKAKEFGLNVYQRPAGDIDMIQFLISLDLPVIVKTWMEIDEDIGHFRVIKGYDRNKKILIQDDSYQGKNIAFTHQEFDQLWQSFNYEFMVLFPEEKKEKVDKILGRRVDETESWKMAMNLAEKQIGKDPNDVQARYNLLRAEYYLGDYQTAVEIFEEIENQLPRRMLWYQFEPILAYYQLENYDRVLDLTQKVFDSQNRAASEYHYLRGKIYEKRNQQNLADEEFRLAETYNQSKYWKVNLTTLDL